MYRNNWYIHDEDKNIIAHGSEEDMSRLMMILTLSKKDLLKTFNEREIDFYRSKYSKTEAKLILVQV